MLPIDISGVNGWSEARNEFIEMQDQHLLLEHSLVSISEWEAKYEKPFLSTTEKSPDELIDYIKMMTLNRSSVDERVYDLLDQETLKEIFAYIQSKQTATWFSDKNKKNSREIITSEIIYCWMTQLNIPFECQTWHLNRLLTLIRVCSEKQQMPKDLSKKQLYSRNTALNKARRAKLHSKG